MMARACAFIWLLAIGAGMAIVWFHPQPPAWTERESTRRLLEENASGGLTVRELPDDVLLVDVRSAQVYGEGHASGAVHLDLDDWETSFAALLMEWAPSRVTVVYCDDTCQASKEVAARLRRELGTEAVYHLQGGWAALKERR